MKLIEHFVDGKIISGDLKEQVKYLILLLENKVQKLRLAQLRLIKL